MHTMRTVALILLAGVLVGLLVLVALVMWFGLAFGIGVGAAIAAGIVGVYVVALGPRQRRWGATDEEVRRRLPGDDALRANAPSTTRAITISTSPENVFPWLLQIGFGRGGWYSYDWIDNDGKRSVEQIDPALQRLAVGDRIEMLPGVGPVVREIVPDRHIVSGGDRDSWCLLVEPMRDGRTRLISRWRQDWPKDLATKVWICIVDPGAFLMEQRMLRNMRDLAERSARPTGLGRRSVPGEWAEACGSLRRRTSETTDAAKRS